MRSEADIIVTNPPFSLFREFIDWIFEDGKKCVIIGNMSTITCKNIFPLVKENKLWLGKGFSSGGSYFKIPNMLKEKGYLNSTFDEETGMVKFGNCCWFTNLEHGRKHQPMQLMTMADNKKFNKKVIKNPDVYKKYDNYDAIEVSYTNAIPEDYKGIMGVPVSFLEKYCPDQFEILGVTENQGVGASNGIINKDSRIKHPLINGRKMYVRILIRHKR